VPDIQETRLPGVGVRHDFTTSEGDRVAVVTYRSGRRELAIYDAKDPDDRRAVLHLSPEDAITLGETLGTSQVSEAVVEAQRLEGLAIEWIALGPSSTAAGTTIADGEFRTRTGASIVAIVRGSTTIPAPEPTVAFEAGDVVVAVGTPDGLRRLRDLLVQRGS
jgi:TrkA domain protein